MRSISTAFIFALTLPLAAAATQEAAQRAADRQAVEQAVLDYVDALYQVDAARIDRSVHPELAKRGFLARGGGAYAESTMSFEQLRSLAERWNSAGRVDPAKAPRTVKVLDVLDQTASAKLTAHWGVDYMHLARYDGRWMIVNVLWQSPPR